MRPAAILFAVMILLLPTSLPAALGQQGIAPENHPTPLTDPDLQTRRDFAAGLRDWTPEALTELLPHVGLALEEEKDSQVRLALLEALQVLGAGAAPVAKSLLESLQDRKVESGREERHQDLRIAMLLGDIGPTALDGLLGLLSSEDENLRANAVLAIGRMHDVPPEAIRQMLKLVKDESEVVRHELARALGSLGSTAGREILAIYATESALPEPVLNGMSRWMELEPGLQELVLSSLQNEAPAVRAAAVSVLNKCTLHSASASKHYLIALQDEDPSVRLAVSNSLFEDTAQINAMKSELEELLLSPETHSVSEVALLLSLTGISSIPTLLAASRDMERIETIGESLARLGRAGYPQLHVAVARGKTTERATAAYALGVILPTSNATVECLSSGLQDDEAIVRKACLVALSKLGSRAQMALPHVHALLDSPSSTMRADAIDAMISMSPRNEELVQRLTTLLVRESDAALQIKIMGKLQSLGSTSVLSLPAVTQLLASSSDEVRLAAASFIGSHGPAAVDSLPDIESLLQDDSEALRLAGIEAVAAMREMAHSVFDELVGLFERDTSNRVRIAALKAMGSIKTESHSLVPFVEVGLRANDRELQQEALRSAGRLGSDGSTLLPTIIELAQDDELKRSVERAIRSFRSKPLSNDVTHRILALTQAPSKNAQLMAIDFLGDLKAAPAEVAAALESLANSADSDIATAATKALTVLNGGKEAEAAK